MVLWFLESLLNGKKGSMEGISVSKDPCRGASAEKGRV
jgi:hypothetical protein